MNVTALVCAAACTATVSAQTADWRPIALTGDPAPGLPGLTFHDVGSPCINYLRGIAFHAVLAGDGVDLGNRESIWIANGPPRLLLRAGETLDLNGETATYLSFPRHGLLDAGDVVALAWVLADAQPLAVLIRVDVQTGATTILAAESTDGSTELDAILSPSINDDEAFAFINGIDSIWASPRGLLQRVVSLGDEVSISNLDPRVVADLDPPTLGTTSDIIGFRTLDQRPDEPDTIGPSTWAWDGFGLWVQTPSTVGSQTNDEPFVTQLGSAQTVTSGVVLTRGKLALGFPTDLDDAIFEDEFAFINEGRFSPDLDAYTSGFGVYLSAAQLFDEPNSTNIALSRFLSGGSSTDLDNTLLSLGPGIGYDEPVAREGDTVGDAQNPADIAFFEAPTAASFDTVYFGAHLRNTEQTNNRALIRYTADDGTQIVLRTADPLDDGTVAGFNITTEPIHSAFGAVNQFEEVVARLTLADGRHGIYTAALYPCPPDINRDGLVNGADLNGFVNLWVAGNPRADVTTANSPDGTPGYGTPDGVVSGIDLNFYVNAWLAGCP